MVLGQASLARRRLQLLAACWESSGGVGLGIAFAVAYFLVNRRMSEEEIEEADALRKNTPTPDWTWLLTYVVYVAALGYIAAPEVMPDSGISYTRPWFPLSQLHLAWGII